MKRLLLLVMFLCVAGIACADEPAVLNDPAGFWDKVKAVVDRAEPRAGAFYNAPDKDILVTTATKLYSKDVHGYTLEGVMGYGINGLAYVSLETDVLAGISKLTGATLAIPWITLNAGPAIGYSYQEEHIAYGFGLNASSKF